MEILSFDQLPSTNAYAIELAKQGAPSNTVVWAHEQTAGHGQYDRRFLSPPGGLYFSIILQSDLPPHKISLVTLAAGVGCCRSLNAFCSIAPLLKWPNDLYLQGRKLGGILTEALPFQKDQKATVIIGVGLNINSMPEDFQEMVSTPVTSVAACTQRNSDLRRLLEATVQEVEQQIHALVENQDKVLAQWQKRDYLKNRLLEWNNGQTVVSGTGQGILPDGRYTLLDSSGKRHEILAGSVRPLDCLQADQHL